MRAYQNTLAKKREPIKKDVKGLESALEEMDDHLDWKETLDMSVDLGEVDNANDDIKRELAFYEASVKAVMDGRKKLKENGIPYLRPDDYLAEMVKDDKKMKMIEQKKTAIEEEKRQKLRKIIIRNKNKKRSNRKKYSRR
ncbi:uncharacterized protein [Blastocystis hominis]|uniref:Uncharacterized protein n=1 Tax=Blastocystis hominis TaxID=12968 RepID=D8MA04_BLAHO|nr:uncharacterized protein [Blastocystis hominis]CBK24893.2 unnamed protein product [Blastocystis hominis]|eukprot:XP_012898941.1 uncharacterized protein [Blastocystis hominis]